MFLHRYERYLIRRMLGPTALIAFSLTGLVWLMQSLRFVDLIVTRGLEVWLFLRLSSLLLPSLLGIVLPISFFIGILYAFHRLAMDSELLVLHGAGVSNQGMLRPVIKLALILTLISYGISLYLLPASYREFKDLQSFIRNNYFSILLQEGIFSSPAKGLTVYIREITEGNGVLKGILVHDSRVPEKPVTMMAEEGQLFKTSQGPRFLLIHGNRQEIDHDNQQLSLLYFDRYAFDLSAYTNPAVERWREPEERYLHELFFTQNEGVTQGNTNKLIAEAHQRLTWPLLNIILALLATIPFLKGQFNRRQQWRGGFSVSLAGGALIGIYPVIYHLTQQTPIAAAGFYLLTFSSLIILYQITRTRSKALQKAAIHAGGGR